MDLSLANVFSPAQEAIAPSQFAGRKVELSNLLFALESNGVHVVIYGDRGVGKSSIARQIENISSGNNELLKKENIPINKRFDFHTIYFTCDDSITELDELFLRLLTDQSCLSQFVPYQETKKSQKNTEKPKFDIKLISLEGSRERSIDQVRTLPTADITGLFISTLKNAERTCGKSDGLLIVLDEFDRIGSVSGFASMLKALSGVRIKFVVTGISNSVHDLVGEHESIGRQLAGGIIHVPPMQSNEMDEIFDIAEAQLKYKYRFETNGRLFAINLSRGHPFYIHLIGKHSLIQAEREGLPIIDEGLMRRAWAEIAVSRAAPIQEQCYREVAGCSFKREMIMKMLASLESDTFFTKNVYPLLAEALKISTGVVSNHVRCLCNVHNVIQEVGRRQYRFSDSMFRAYAAARPMLQK
jgi:Cdc6-like AAA superfamily ATPase